MSDDPSGNARRDDDFTRQVRPAPPRRRLPPSAVARAASVADGALSPDALARVRAEISELATMVAGIAEDLSRLDDKTAALAGVVRSQRDQGSDLMFHLESLGTAIRVDHGAVETQLSSLQQTVRHLEDALVPMIENKVDAAVTDLLAALDHELSEQYERSVLQSKEVSEGLEALKVRDEPDMAKVRKSIGELGRGLRKEVADQLARVGERQDSLEQAIREVLAEVTALKRRIPLRAGDQELSPEERNRLAASIARLLHDDAAGRPRPTKAQGVRKPRGG